MPDPSRAVNVSVETVSLPATRPVRPPITRDGLHGLGARRVGAGRVRSPRRFRVADRRAPGTGIRRRTRRRTGARRGRASGQRRATPSSSLRRLGPGPRRFRCGFGARACSRCSARSRRSPVGPMSSPAAAPAGDGWADDDDTLLAQGRASGFGGTMLAAMAVPALEGLAGRVRRRRLVRVDGAAHSRAAPALYAGPPTDDHGTAVTAAPDCRDVGAPPRPASRRILFTCRPLFGHLQPLIGLAEAARAAGCAVAFATAEPAIGWVRDAGFVAFEAGEPDTFRLVWQPRFPQLATLVGDAQREFWFTTVFADLELAPRARDLEAIMSALAARPRGARGRRARRTAREHVARHPVRRRRLRLVDPATAPGGGRGRGATTLVGQGSGTRTGGRPVPLPVRRPVPADAAARPRSTTLPWVQRIRPQAAATAPAERPEHPRGAAPSGHGVPHLGDDLEHPHRGVPHVLEALRDDVNVIVTVGRTQQPDNARAANRPAWWSASSSRSTRCCRGARRWSATVVRARCSARSPMGLPVLVAPQGADQWSNAQLVAGAGAGRLLLGDEVTVESVRRDVMALLHTPSYARRRARDRRRDRLDAVAGRGVRRRRRAGVSLADAGAGAQLPHPRRQPCRSLAP